MTMEHAYDLSQISEVELIYKNQTRYADRPKVQSSRAAFNIFRDTWDAGKINLQEQFKVMLLDTGMSCLGISLISSGGIAACHVDLKLVFATALKARASRIVLAHNHPSGNDTPSPSDLQLTEQFKKAGSYLQIQVVDHLIITNEGYTSIADEGLCGMWPDNTLAHPPAALFS